MESWPEGSRRRKKYNLMKQYDPRPHLERLIMPVLAVYGGRDRNAPYRKNVEALERAMRKAGEKDYTTKVLPTANRAGMEAETGLSVATSRRV